MSAPVLGADLLVAAASDLATSERALREEFEKVTGHKAQFVLQSSGMLARQIQSGAPYDIYLSANEQYVKDLAASGHLVPASVRVYAIGRLGLWSKSGSVRKLEDLRDGKIRHVAIANPAYAPYGMAAKQALEGAKLWRELQPKIVLAENVRQTFQYGQSGNADAVITSWTLVGSRGGVMVAAELHRPIRQAGGVVKASGNQELGRRFLDFLAGPAGRAVLEAHGLFPVE